MLLMWRGGFNAVFILKQIDEVESPDKEKVAAFSFVGCFFFAGLFFPAC